MTYDKTMRALRLKHRVTYSELAQGAGVSIQRIVAIELSQARKKSKQLSLMQKAFEKAIEKRKASVEQLCADYSKLKARLLCYEEADI